MTVLRDVSQLSVIPADTATLDHLRPRHHPERRQPARHGEKRVVIACWKCNNSRDQIEYAAIPLELKHELAGTNMLVDLKATRGAFFRIQRELEEADDYLQRLTATMRDRGRGMFSEPEFDHFVRGYIEAVQTRLTVGRAVAGGLVDRIDRQSAR